MDLTTAKHSLSSRKEDIYNNNLHHVSTKSFPASICGRGRKTVKGFYTSSAPLQLQMNHLGEISFPISKEVTDDILGSTSGTLIPGCVSLSSGYLAQSFFVARLVKELLDVDLNHLNIDVEAKVRNMVVHQADNNNKVLLSVNDQIPAGTFGTFIIQLPIEGGYIGGVMTATNPNGLEYQISFSSRSNVHFCVLACCEPANVVMQPIQTGTFLGLIFDIVWSDHTLLKHWDRNYFVDLVRQAALARDSQIAWQPISPENGSLQISSTNSSKENRKHNNIYCHLLQNTYLSALNCDCLEGPDRLLITALKLVDFIDVHLVILQSEKEDGCSEAKRTWEIAHWLESAAGTPVPKGRRIIKDTQIINWLSKYSLADQAKVLLLPAIAIQPRYSSIYTRCTEVFDEVVDCLKQRIPSNSPSQRKQLLSDLKCCLEFCRENFKSVWRNSKGHRTYNLFDICIKMKAKEEGFMLLDIVTRTFAYTQKSEERFMEGIRDVTVASKIAEFINQLSDWSRCRPLILRMINKSCLTSQLGNICILAIKLIEVERTEAAEEIFDKISFTCDGLTEADIAKIEVNHFQEYLNLSAACGNNERAKKLAVKLERAKHTDFLPDWKIGHSKREKANFQSHLCKLLANGALCIEQISESSNERVEPHLKLQNRSSDHSFIRSACKEITSTGSPRKHPLIEKLMLRHLTLNNNEDFLEGLEDQEEISEFIDQLIVYLKNEVVEDEAYQAKLLACFHCVCFRETNDRQLNVLAKIFEKLTVSSLCLLIGQTSRLQVPPLLNKRLCEIISQRSPVALLAENTEILLQVVDFVKNNVRIFSSFCLKLCNERTLAANDVCRRNRLIIYVLTGLNDGDSSRFLVKTLLEGFVYLLHSPLQNEIEDQISALHSIWPRIRAENKDLTSQFAHVVNCITMQKYSNF